nr:hypothetical protein [Bradyrhizobium sp.]
MGVRTRDARIRRLTTSPYPFLVFYEITSDEIVIHATAMVHAIHQACQVPNSPTDLNHTSP